MKTLLTRPYSPWIQPHWDELWLRPAGQVAVLSDLRVPEGTVLMRSWHPRDPNCRWQTAAVDAYGNPIGCPYLRDFVSAP